MPKKATKTGSDDKHVDVTPTNVPEAEVKPAGVMNTTETEYSDDELAPAPRKGLTDADRKEIKSLFNKEGAVIANIANKFDIEPSEVFAIAEGK